MYVGPATSSLVGCAAHVEGTGEGAIVAIEVECKTFERRRRGAENVHGGEGGAVPKGKDSDAGHGSGYGDGGDGRIEVECSVGDGDDAVGDGDVTADATADVGYMSKIDDGGAGLGCGEPWRVIEGTFIDVGKVIASVDGGEVAALCKGIFADIGDAAANADGSDVTYILLPGAVLVVQIVVVSAARAGDAKRAVVVVAPAGIVAAGACDLPPLGVEVDRRALLGREVADALSVGVARAATVSIGGPPCKDVVLAGDTLDIGGYAVGHGHVDVVVGAVVMVQADGVTVGRNGGADGDGLSGHGERIVADGAGGGAVFHVVAGVDRAAVGKGDRCSLIAVGLTINIRTVGVGPVVCAGQCG